MNGEMHEKENMAKQHVSTIVYVLQITDQRERYDRAIRVLVSLYLASLMGAFGDKVCTIWRIHSESQVGFHNYLHFHLPQNGR